MDDRPRPTFSANDLRASLGLPDVVVNDPDAMTIKELAEWADASENTIRRRLTIALKTGTWVSVGLQRRYRGNGARYDVEAFKRTEAALRAPLCKAY